MVGEFRLLTRAEVAERLHISTWGVCNLCDAGELAFLAGPPVLIPETELRAYVERRLIRERPKGVNQTTTPEESARRLIEKAKADGSFPLLLKVIKRSRTLALTTRSRRR